MSTKAKSTKRNTKARSAKKSTNMSTKAKSTKRNTKARSAKKSTNMSTKARDSGAKKGARSSGTLKGDTTVGKIKIGGEAGLESDYSSGEFKEGAEDVFGSIKSGLKAAKKKISDIYD